MMTAMTTEATQFVVLLAVSWLVELLLTVRWLWPLRKVLVLVSLAALSAGSIGIVMIRPTVWSWLLLLVAVYRGFNLLRAMHGRVQEAYARQHIRQTALWLGFAQAGLLLINTLDVAYTGIPNTLGIVSALLLSLALMLAWLMLRHIQKTSPAAAHPGKLRLHDRDLPSLTVAIPARNEDAQLEACLDAMLASDYPKLEIIVLDDCSADRTPDIIKGYAQRGVRFVRGHEPSNGWLAKNQAYDKLYQEASGALILFCGVDVRVRRSSIRHLVTSLIQRDKTMVSVLPLNPAQPGAQLPLAQLMRYFWELAPPRRLFNRPPVLSTCWLITKDSLAEAGGFAAVRRSITPEAHFARRALAHDGYAFVRSNRQLSITSFKPAAAQLSTAIQTRYPQLHRRPEMVLLVALTECGLILVPAAIAVYAAATQQWWVAALAIATLVLHSLTFQALWHVTFTYRRPLSSLLFLPAIVTDIVLLHYSMYKYEFSEVYWKGRNVRGPVMRVYPHLPKI